MNEWENEQVNRREWAKNVCSFECGEWESNTAFWTYEEAKKIESVKETYTVVICVNFFLYVALIVVAMDLMK